MKQLGAVLTALVIILCFFWMRFEFQIVEPREGGYHQFNMQFGRWKRGAKNETGIDCPDCRGNRGTMRVPGPV